MDAYKKSVQQYYNKYKHVINNNYFIEDEFNINADQEQRLTSERSAEKKKKLLPYTQLDSYNPEKQFEAMKAKMGQIQRMQNEQSYHLNTNLESIRQQKISPVKPQKARPAQSELEKTDALDASSSKNEADFENTLQNQIPFRMPHSEPANKGNSSARDDGPTQQEQQAQPRTQKPQIRLHQVRLQKPSTQAPSSKDTLPPEKKYSCSEKLINSSKAVQQQQIYQHLALQQQAQGRLQQNVPQAQWSPQKPLQHRVAYGPEEFQE